MEHLRVGYAFCGSFCTYSKAMAVLEQVAGRYDSVQPIVSEASAATDTRFGNAHDFMPVSYTHLTLPTRTVV